MHVTSTTLQCIHLKYLNHIELQLSVVAKDNMFIYVVVS